MGFPASKEDDPPKKALMHSGENAHQRGSQQALPCIAIARGQGYFLLRGPLYHKQGVPKYMQHHRLL
jgi:hypothetical protein